MDINDPNVRIQYLVTKKTDIGEFRDAIYFSPDEFAAMTKDEVEAKADTRVNNWVESVKNPPKPPADNVPADVDHG